MSAKSADAAPVPVKSLELQPFNPSENAEIELLHAATMDPDDERAKRIRAECNKHIMSHALKHKDFNFKTDISVWRMPGGRIVWTSPLVRAPSKGCHKPLDRSAMPQAVIDALQNGSTYMGLELPTCAREDLKKAVRKKPTPAASAAMPATDALLDSIARRVSLVNGDAAHDNDAMPIDDTRNSIVVATYQQYAGDMLTMRDGVARAGLFSVHDTTKTGDFVRGLMGANSIDEERSPSDWVRVLGGRTPDAAEGEFTRQQAMILGASAVHDVTTRLASVAADMVAVAEKRAALADASAHALRADVAMYRERNTALEAENAALTAALAAAKAAPAPADDAPKPAKPARKRAPSNGAPAAKRAAASAAAAPVLPAAELEAELEAELDAQPSDDMFNM